MENKLKKINRVALTLIPKQGFVDFINRLHPSAPIKLEAAYKEGFQIYLVPNFEDTKKAEAYLKRVCPHLLTQEFDSWQIKPADRPQPLNFEAFKNFFEYDVSVGIFDTTSVLK